MYIRAAARSLTARSKATRTTTGLTGIRTASKRDHQAAVVTTLLPSVFTTTSARASARASARCFSSFSTYSSFAEPDPTLFAKYNNTLEDPNASASSATTVFAGAAAATADDAQLRADIRVMGSVLGMVIRKHQGGEIFDKVEEMRSLAKAWREAVDTSSNNNGDSFFPPLAAFAQKLSNQELFLVSRAFTHFLAIANAAEGHHRTRRLKQAVWPESESESESEYQQQQQQHKSCGALYPKNDSCGGVIPDLVLSGRHSVEAIWQALSTQTTELVLTAHPTEVNRRTILEKKRRIQKIVSPTPTPGMRNANAAVTTTRFAAVPPRPPRARWPRPSGAACCRRC